MAQSRVIVIHHIVAVDERGDANANSGPDLTHLQPRHHLVSDPLFWSFDLVFPQCRIASAKDLLQDILVTPGASLLYLRAFE